MHDADLEGHIITVPEVRMSPDLKLATIYVMPLGGRDTELVIAALERNKKFLRGEVARRVNLKFAPDLRFRVDERFDEAERIEKIIANTCGAEETWNRIRTRIGKKNDDDGPGSRARSSSEEADTRDLQKNNFADAPMLSRIRRRAASTTIRAPEHSRRAISRAATGATSMAGSCSTSRSA